MGLTATQEAHISFIDHHFTLSSTSDDPLDPVFEEGAIIPGVCAVSLPLFDQWNSTHDNIPHHLVETLVQAEAHSDYGGQRQAVAWVRFFSPTPTGSSLPRSSSGLKD